MQTQKISLANIKGKLGRAEMKNVMAGRFGWSGGEETYKCCVRGSTTDCGNSCTPHPNCTSNAEAIKC